MKILKLREGFEICGLKTRTNNANEMSGRGVIANLWGEFLKFNASRSSAEKTKFTPHITTTKTARRANTPC
ncbi:hypothetical protein [uncultured Campylobacter sp.]|uniref:hypothetical protein n=1 Tax=uncultured Campylobacter sp. TaxID=218934 RepID=UPI002625FAE9|nr:hypothetical protein [uncultured Campylobacter sp.]